MIDIHPLIVETALLILAAYLLGCVAGYGVRLVLHAGRGTRLVVPVPVPAAADPAAPPPPVRPRSNAARLAASVDGPPAPATKPAPALPQVATAATRSKPPKSADPKPAVLAAPRDGRADNLKQIKGIGPKIEASLHAMGIFHLDQIAGWNKANIDWVDSHLAFKGRIRRERWVEQALDLGKARADA